MTTRFPQCRTCSGRLFAADLLTNSDTCCECERKSILLAADPWRFFVRTLRANVRPDGTVHVNDVRELLRGRIEPKQIGLLWKRAKTVGLITGGSEWEPSTDQRGGNDDKQARIWRATEELRSVQISSPTQRLWLTGASRGVDDVARQRAEADAAFVASWHPAVALAVADWLECQADTTCDCGVDESALAVARAYLGEQS